MNNNLFDDIIKQNMDGHESAVPDDVWNNISAGKRKRRFAFWWWLLPVVLAGIGLTVFLNKNTDAVQDTKQLAQNDHTPQSKERTNSNDRNESNNIANTVTLIDTTLADGTAYSNRSDPQNDSAAPGQTKTIKGKYNINIGSAAAADNDNRKTNNNDRYTTIRKNAKVDVRLNGSDYNTDTNNEDGRFAKNKKRSRNNAKAKMSVKPEETDSQTEPATTITEDIAVSKPADLKPDPTAEEKIVVNVPGNVFDSVKKATVAQTETAGKKKEEKKNKKSSWSFELSAMPLIGLQQYDKDLTLKRTIINGDLRTDFTSTSVKTSLEPSLAFSAAVVKTLNKRFAAGIGIQYLQLKENFKLTGTETTTKTTIVKRLVDDPAGSYLKDDSVKTVNSGIRTVNALNSYSILSIPVFLRYELLQKGKFKLAANVGVYFNLKTSYSNSINGSFTTSDGSRATGKTNAAISLFTGLRGSLKIFPKTELSLTPSFIYKPSSYQLNNSVLNKRIHQAGIAAGILVKF